MNGFDLPQSGKRDMINIKRYDESDINIWNCFNGNSKNHLFMFDRGYMDYHKDRFQDHSLIFDSDGDVVALLPACENDGALVSHAGLTFGGFITNDRMKQHTMNDCVTALIAYAKEQGWNSITYKMIPHCYHSQPAEEDWFSLYANGAKLITVDVSTVIDLSNPLKMPKGRKAQISRAKREGVEVRILEDIESYRDFIDMENEILELRHNTHAVHTADELMLLHSRFPDNINLYGALKDGRLIAGIVVYEYDRVVHTQYMASNDEARTIGALDLIIAGLIEKYRDNKLWLDFGISTEHDLIYLNEGLVSQKEGFGGRTNIYAIWKLDLGTI